MNKIILVLLVLFLASSTGQVFAHEHENETVHVSTTDSLMQIEMEAHQQMEAVSAFPNYHPLVVHFPIVLLIIATLFQLLSFFVFKKEFSWVAFILLASGTITSWLSSNTFHAETGTLTGVAKEIFETHEQMADLTWWFSLAALLAKIISHFFMNRKMWLEIIASVLLLASAITVSIAGHHGAMLVHMEGIGPMGKYLESYKLPEKSADQNSQSVSTEPTKIDDEEKEATGQEADHEVGEVGEGPHGGTIEEAEPFHMEIVAENNDLIFYLLDGDAKPVDMKNVNGIVKMLYAKKSTETIELMEMKHKLTAMNVNTGEAFNAVCTLTKNGKSYSATFRSTKDLLHKK